MTTEIWKDIPDYEGSYQASTLGRIKSLPRSVNRNGSLLPVRGCIKKGAPNHKGYLLVVLKNSKTGIGKAIHRWVALTFIPNPLNLPQVNHKDGDKLNNRVDNLEWCTASYNMKHAYDTGLANKKGERQEQAKFTDDEVRGIKNSKESVNALAKRYNVTYQCIWQMKNNYSWTHIA